MPGIGFFKGQPTDYVIKYVSGRVRAEGQGLAFYYLSHNTNVVAVPTSSSDADFVFNEITNNFQEVTIQGQFTWRISEPRTAASLLNYAIVPRSRTYLSDEPERLPQRIRNILQMQARGEILSRTLEAVIAESEMMDSSILERVRTEALLEPMGVELLNLYFLSVRPAPDVGKALEADYREALLRRADEATYARRAAAVEQERKIKENELNTDIALEQQREQRIDLEGSNLEREAVYRGAAMQREAEFRARAMELETTAYADVEPLKILSFAVREVSTRLERLLGDRGSEAAPPYEGR